MFDVKQLRVLRSVAEHGSFSAAADALSYTQPAISQQIAALERHAGTTLVDRGSRGVSLTDAGRTLVEHAEVIIARLGAAEAELEAIAGIRGGRVRLSSFPSAGASLLPPAVALFKSRHPEVELNFAEQEPEEAVQMLRAAELEVVARVRVPQPLAAGVRAPVRGHRAAPPDRRSDVPRPAPRPSGRAQAARAASGRVGRRLDPERHNWPVRTPPPRGLQRRGLRAEDRLPVGRLQRRPGPDRRRRGRVAAAGAVAHQRARGHRRALARQGRAHAQDRRRHAGRPLPFARDRGHARHLHRGGRGLRAACPAPRSQPKHAAAQRSERQRFRRPRPRR